MGSVEVTQLEEKQLKMCSHMFTNQIPFFECVKSLREDQRRKGKGKVADR